MQLFDNTERHDDAPSDFLESSFEHLNRSARSDFQRIREITEQWFSKYPVQEQAELRSRFRSRLNVHHTSAYFELFLHELLLNLGCTLIIHPNIANTDRSPDFLVTTRKSESFYLEAAVTTFQSDEEVAAESRLNQVYDVLNRRVDSTNFFISVEIDSFPNSQPPGKKIAQFLNQKLRDIDPDEIAEMYKSERYKAVPNWVFKHDDWAVTFSPIPKKPSKRGKATARPLGFFSSGVKFVDNRTPLRNTITGKANAYGELDKPYIVAVNALEVIDEIDVMEALFGKEQYKIVFSENGLREDASPRMTRKPDGVWTSPTGPKNTKLSGVFVVRNLRPWSLRETVGCLYHNPWALYPGVSLLTELTKAVALESRMEKEVGKAIVEILGIDWSEVSN